VISRFRRGIDKKRAVLVYDAVVIPYRRFGTTYQSYLNLTLEDGTNWSS